MQSWPATLGDAAPAGENAIARGSFTARWPFTSRSSRKSEPGCTGFKVVLSNQPQLAWALKVTSRLSSTGWNAMPVGSSPTRSVRTTVTAPDDVRSKIVIESPSQLAT